MSSIRKKLQGAVKTFIDSIPPYTPTVDVAMEDLILDLAEILAVGRTYVHRERNEDLICLPQAELASRVTKQLLRVGQSVALVRGKPSVTADEFTMMKRVALDSLPSNRRALLAALWKFRKKAEPLATFKKRVGRLAETTLRRELHNLVELKAVKSTKKQVIIKGMGKTTKEFFQLAPTFAGYCKNIGGISSP